VLPSGWAGRDTHALYLDLACPSALLVLCVASGLILLTPQARASCIWTPKHHQRSRSNWWIKTGPAWAASSSTWTPTATNLSVQVALCTFKHERNADMWDREGVRAESKGCSYLQPFCNGCCMQLPPQWAAAWTHTCTCILVAMDAL
jgi:hypothetical protein